jgi:hypothetical protein
MPKTKSTLDRIHDIVTRAASEIASAIRGEISSTPRRAALPAHKAAPSARGGKRRTIMCPVPGCGKPGGGPKWGWFCADHKDLPAEEKARARAARAGAATAPKAKAARGAKRGGREGAKRGGSALDQVLAFVRSNPGMRSEQIQKRIGLAAEPVKAALAKLRAGGQVKVSGKARATSYAPA